MKAKNGVHIKMNRNEIGNSFYINDNFLRLRIAYFQSVIKTICEDLVLLDKIILTHRLFCYYCTILLNLN
jgi:hypothetical protein